MPLGLLQREVLLLLRKTSRIPPTAQNIGQKAGRREACSKKGTEATSPQQLRFRLLWVHRLRVTKMQKDEGLLRTLPVLAYLTESISQRNWCASLKVPPNAVQNEVLTHSHILSHIPGCTRSNFPRAAWWREPSMKTPGDLQPAPGNDTGSSKVPLQSQL